MPVSSGAAGTASPMNNNVVDSYAPNTVVAVGNQQVEVLSYIAEGGFAQIYSVKYLKFLGEFENGSKAPLNTGDIACLKRVLVPDDNGLSEMRNEVEVMKQLRGAKSIIQYYDSNASRRGNGQVGYEVLLLMELCPNNSLLDYMNQRLATKLSEKEVLKVMYDTTLAISQMHYLPVPLIHRDIKIENVLVDAENNFKLCDFGSTSTCLPLASTHQDIAILTQNIYVNTTPQYRSPEMIDLYRCLPINEKSDIWALGIFLYKLLFFITPFEMTGQFAILHSKYEFPPNRYSSKLINLIIIMLAENPYLRPNIYQVMHHICGVIGCEVPIEDKYGIGPYNFEKYTQFQTKLQNVQYQMYLLQQKKLENNGRLNNVEEKLLNDLLVASFEVSTKVPIEFGIPQPTKSREAANSSDEYSDHMKSVFSSRKPSRNPSNASRKNVPNNDLENELDSNVDASVPSGERDSYRSPQNEKSGEGASPFSSGKSLSNGPPVQGSKSTDALSGEHTAMSEQSPGFIKQHKSKNPFPMMAQSFGQGGQATTHFSAEMPAAVPTVTETPDNTPVPGKNNGAASSANNGVAVGPRGSRSSTQLERANSRSEYFVDNSSQVDETQFNHLHQNSQLSQAAQVPQVPQVPQAAQAPQAATPVPQAAQVAQAAPVPQAAQVAQAPQAAQVAQVAQVPQAAQVPPAAQVPQATQVSQAAQVSSAVQVPQAAQVVQAAQVPLAVQVPQGAQAPQAAPAPQAAVPVPQATPVPQAAQPQQAPQPPQAQSRVNQNVFYQQIDSPISVPGQAQSHVRFNYQVPQKIQPGTSPYYSSSPVGSRASLSAQQPLSQISLQQQPQVVQVQHQRPRPLPPPLSEQGFISHNEPTRKVPQYATNDLVNPPENPPPIPPHPRTWQDYQTRDASDLDQSLHRRIMSDQKSRMDPTRLEKTSSRNLDLTYNRLDLNADDVVIPTRNPSRSLSRNPSRNSWKHRALTPSSGELSTASSESIEIDLDDARKDRDRIQQQPNINSSTGSLRRSLDLKYQEVHFSSPELRPQPLKEPAIKEDISDDSRRSIHNEIRRQTNGNANNYNAPPTVAISPGAGPDTITGSAPSQQDNDLVRCKSSRKNSSNSSINGAPNLSTSNGGSEFRRSFAKARQSLDLEKIRRDALKGEQTFMGKRKSLFSVFRNSDKK